MAARERIDTLRKSPSITGAPIELPAKLAGWGLDESTWSQIRSKATLLALADADDEAAARAKIDQLRKAIAAEEAARPPTGGEAFERRKARREASNTGVAKPLSSGYTLEGVLPPTVDSDRVALMIQQRVEAKQAKDYAAADNLQEELKSMGVLVNDRKRTYFAA